MFVYFVCQVLWAMFLMVVSFVLEVIFDLFLLLCLPQNISLFWIKRVVDLLFENKCKRTLWKDHCLSFCVCFCFISLSSPFTRSEPGQFHNASEGLAYFDTLLSKEERLEAIADNPAAVARWFKVMVQIFIEEIFGFDVKLKRPKRGGGAFGFVCAYVGGVEGQGRETLISISSFGCWELR